MSGCDGRAGRGGGWMGRIATQACKSISTPSHKLAGAHGWTPHTQGTSTGHHIGCPTT